MLPTILSYLITFIYVSSVAVAAPAKKCGAASTTSISSHASTTTHSSSSTSSSTKPSSIKASSSSPTSSASGSTSVTADQILKFAPDAKSCDPSAQFADECRTADQAVPFINAGFNKYGISTRGEKAALLSLMTFETGEFKFDTNHFPAPGRPGQGTRNLMTFPFILQYARNTTTPYSSPSAQIHTLLSTSTTNPSSVSDSLKNQIRELVLPDTLSFASAAWFLKASGACNSGIVQGLRDATMQGWENYISQCVGTDVTDDRRSAYTAALAALS